MKIASVYKVFKITRPVKIDADWYKPLWKNIEPAEIVNYMGIIPGFQPKVQAKMMYNEENLYVIFHVQDCFVRCITKDINGPVWEDSCVEFFFSPDINHPEKYFNLEINCGGTPLVNYNIIPNKEIIVLTADDIKKVEIAHSLPEIIDPELTKPVDWTIEYRIPIDLIEKYSPVTHPVPGTEWRANFYKIAENSSNPHYITWSVVKNDKPEFHIPGFFGLLRFQ